MKEKTNDATLQRPEGNRTIDAPLVTIDLTSLTEQIKNEKPWDNGDRNAITVFKTDGMRILLIALREDAEMARHTVDGTISLMVLEGQIVFDTDEICERLIKGQVIALHKGVPHSVRATEESVFLLTLTTSLES